MWDEEAASIQEGYGEVSAGWRKPGLVLGLFASRPLLALPLLGVIPWLPAHSASGRHSRRLQGKGRSQGITPPSPSFSPGAALPPASPLLSPLLVGRLLSAVVPGSPGRHQALFSLSLLTPSEGGSLLLLISGSPLYCSLASQLFYLLCNQPLESNSLYLKSLERFVFLVGP